MRGIVRRIDELGRIVIPKEIRSLMRIKDGDMIEIKFDDELIKLSKYSKISNIEDIGSILCMVLHNSCKKNVILCDLDKFIISYGLKVEGDISDKLIFLLNERKFIDDFNDEYSYLISPIISNGDVVGGVILLSKDGNFVDNDRNLLKMTSQILEKYIEE